jgi:hypothetical protein
VSFPHPTESSSGGLCFSPTVNCADLQDCVSWDSKKILRKIECKHCSNLSYTRAKFAVSFTSKTFLQLFIHDDFQKMTRFVHKLCTWAIWQLLRQIVSKS